MRRSALVFSLLLLTGYASSNIVIDHSEDFIFDGTPVKANDTLTTNDRLIANGILEANLIIAAKSGISSEDNIAMNGNNITGISDLQSDTKGIVGDVNQDDQVNLLDAVAMQKDIAGITNHCGNQNNPDNRCDIDGDGKLTIDDPVVLQQYFAGLRDSSSTELNWESEMRRGFQPFTIGDLGSGTGIDSVEELQVASDDISMDFRGGEIKNISDITTDKSYILGDVNQDGRIGHMDVSQLQTDLAGITNNCNGADRCDVDGDGDIDIVDAVYLQALLRGFDVSSSNLNFESKLKTDRSLFEIQNTGAALSEVSQYKYSQGNIDMSDSSLTNISSIDMGGDDIKNVGNLGGSGRGFPENQPIVQETLNNTDAVTVPSGEDWLVSLSSDSWFSIDVNGGPTITSKNDRESPKLFFPGGTTIKNEYDTNNHAILLVGHDINSEVKNTFGKTLNPIDSYYNLSSNSQVYGVADGTLKVDGVRAYTDKMRINEQFTSGTTFEQEGSRSYISGFKMK